MIELSSRISAPEEDSVTDEINLTWGVPDDDGGYPITGIVKISKFKVPIIGKRFDAHHYAIVSMKKTLTN